MGDEMTSEELTIMARKCGLLAGADMGSDRTEMLLMSLGMFAELASDKANCARIVAQMENEALKAKLAKSGLDKWRAVREAVAAEREACANVCDALPVPSSCYGMERSLWDVATTECASSIRARGSQ